MQYDFTAYTYALDTYKKIKKVYADRDSNLVLCITWISIKGANGECFNVMFKFAVQLGQIIDGAGSCQKL